MYTIRFAVLAFMAVAMIACGKDEDRKAHV